jgi:hypothetical protein
VGGCVGCETKKISESWGTMMQKAIELKKKKNLEPLKGNIFAPLQCDDLDVMSMDINIKVGLDKSDKFKILNNMIYDEESRVEQFVG